VLARYMLPVVPLVILVVVSTLWRRARYWKWIVGAVAIAFAAGLFSNPPYGFSLEDNLAYRDYIVMHVEASRFLAMRYPGARVLTAWRRPTNLRGHGLVMSMSCSLFASSASRIFQRRRCNWPQRPRPFDVALAFSTKYEPPHPLLENWMRGSASRKFFGYHRDLLPEEIAQRLGGRFPIARNERAVGRGDCDGAVISLFDDGAMPRPSGHRLASTHVQQSRFIRWHECVLTTTQTLFRGQVAERRAPPASGAPRTPCRRNRRSPRRSHLSAPAAE